VKRFFALLLLAALAGTLGLLHWLVRNDAYGDFPEPVFVNIPRGTSSWAVGAALTKAGVIRNPLLYQFSRLTRLGKGAQAGEYQFTHAATPAQVFARLASGDIFHIDLVVPEGSTMFDIANLVERAGIGTAAAFLREARSPALISDLAPSAPSLEGYLFPATYRFGRGSTAGDICRAMTAHFRRVLAELGMSGDPTRTVTLASMVEKEAMLSAERPRIAGVYMARLRQGMKLDCDPTVIYAAQLEGRWSGVIRHTDLTSHNRYNTYTNPGLPPGPIANPGRDSLRAALQPLETGDLYFVAEPGATGAHVFSKDLATHDKAVSSYRRDHRRRQ
jgi:UPF0755 protein